MARHVNEEGLALIRQWEGLRLTAYRDPAGIWSIGYGHTDAAGPPAVRPGLTLTEPEAAELLRRDLARFETAVEAAVTVPLTDNQFAALVSFVYNVGPANFARSTLLKKLNAGDHGAVPRELAKWTRAGGKALPGLANRRAAEAGLWAKGAFVASQYVEPVPAPKVDGLAGHGAAATLAGLVGTGATEAAEQLLPFASASALLQHLFVALSLLGAATTLVGVWQKARQEAGLA
ncbi:lysozyme [Ancylobacter lacus]|uniref:lysozyme n=1 Tax=Ancylobacter lacus TaxID=2579970 RepID=UPI001BCF9BE5|nr:lysozyme [Ancylobacter lacus]MBS7539397.1 lysozyme [Ancylobacter lacus]